MFVREGILDPLSTALLAILKDTSITTEDPSTRAVQVLLLFCQVAQADARVRDAFATRMIMSRKRYPFRFVLMVRSPESLRCLAAKDSCDCDQGDQTLID